MKKRDAQLREGKLKLTNQTSGGAKAGSGERGAQSVAEARDPELAFREMKKKGNELYADGEYEQAIACYSECARMNPKSAVAFANRGMAYLKLHRYEQAETDCTLALRLDASFIKALNRRVVARKNQGKLEAALRDAEQMVQLDGKNAAALSLCKQLRAAAKKLRNALSAPESRGDASTAEAKRVQAVEVVDEDDESEGEDGIEEGAGGGDRPRPKASPKSGANR